MQSASKVKATLWDRCVAAYYGFVDVERVLRIVQEVNERVQEIQKKDDAIAAKHDAALSNLEGYDKALVVSVAGGTANWRELLGQVMPAIETLSVADQITIIRYISRGNYHVVLTPEIQQWMRRHAKDLLDALPE